MVLVQLCVLRHMTAQIGPAPRALALTTSSANAIVLTVQLVEHSNVGLASTAVRIALLGILNQMCAPFFGFCCLDPSRSCTKPPLQMTALARETGMGVPAIFEIPGCVRVLGAFNVLSLTDRRLIDLCMLLLQQPPRGSVANASNSDGSSGPGAGEKSLEPQIDQHSLELLAAAIDCASPAHLTLPEICGLVKAAVYYEAPKICEHLVDYIQPVLPQISCIQVSQLFLQCLCSS